MEFSSSRVAVACLLTYPLGSWNHLLNESLAPELLPRSLLLREPRLRQLAIVLKLLLCAVNCARHLKHIFFIFSFFKKKKGCRGHLAILPSLYSNKKLRLEVVVRCTRSVGAEWRFHPRSLRIRNPCFIQHRKPELS